MRTAALPLRAPDLLWYGATIAVAVAAVLLGQWLGFPQGLAALALLLFFPAALYTANRWPESVVYLLLLVVTFANEYSQTEWGVRSADQLATLYNRRLIPGVIASVFDLLFVTVLALWAGRKWLRREPLAWPPRFLWLPALLSLGFTFYATMLGMQRLGQGYELYYILRELRPFAYAVALFIVTVDQLTIRARVETLWRLALVVAFVHGVQGVIRHYLGLGRWYYGTTMVYYDYSDTIVMLAGLSFLFVWLLGRPQLRLRTLLLVGLAATPMLYTFIFSYRRSFWIGTAASLALLFLALNRRERGRYLALAALGGATLLSLVLLTGQVGLVWQRVVSITDAQNDPSNYFRLFDNENALHAIYESGAVGMGFGSRYRVVASIYWLHDFISHVSRASHNGYFYLLMKMGLLGTLSWTLFWLANLAVCIDLLRRPAGRFRHVGLGVAVILVACAVANTFLPLYYNLRPLLLLAIFSGLACAAWNHERAAPSPP